MIHPKKIRFYLSPYFIVRYFITKDISGIAKKYKIIGSTIDIGSGSKPFRYLFKDINSYKGIDFKNCSINNSFHVEKPDFYFDEKYLETSQLPFDNNSFDNCFSFQVLEHCIDYQKTISEMIRITKKNGFILISFPFIGGLHEKPNDFQRLTHFKIKDIFKKNNCDILEIKKQGSIFSTISILLNEYLNNFASKNRFNLYLFILIYFPFFLFQYISLFLDKIFKSDDIFINYVVLIRKK